MIPVEGHEDMYIEGAVFCVATFRAPLDNRLFDAEYRAGILLTDFGFYRVGEVVQGLVPKGNLGRAVAGLAPRYTTH